MQKYINYTALLLAVAVALLSWRSCNNSVKYAMKEKELKDTKAALLACKDSMPLVTTDTVCVTKWKTVTKRYTLRDTITDTLYIANSEKVQTYIDTILDEDVDISYIIEAVRLEGFQLNHRVKTPKTIIKTETRIERVEVTPWRVDGWIGYGFYNKSALVGVTVTTPSAIGFGAFVDAFNKDAGFTMSLRVR